MSGIEEMLNAVEWEECAGDPSGDGSLPHMTHKGVLRIGDIELQCAMLSSGQRIFYGDVVEQLFGFEV